MYPVVPDLLQKFTVKSGQAGDDVRASTVLRTEWHGVPRFETGDLGRGTQITKVWANGVELLMERQHPVDLAYHDTSLLTGEMALQGHAFWDTESISTNTSTEFQATYSNASSGDEITVKATAVQSGDPDRPDYIKFELAGSGVSISTSGRTLGGWEWPRLAIKPPAQGNSERGLATVPYIRGQATGLPYEPFPFGDIGCIWPDAAFSAGDSANKALEGNLAQPCSFQFTHVYDRDSFAGAMLVVADPETHYKVQIQGGTGSAHKMATRHLPPNGRGRTSLGTSDASGGYSVRLIPFRGEVNDAAKEYRTTMVRDLEADWVPTKTLDDYRESLTTGWGFGEKRSGMFAQTYWWTVFQFANYSEDAGGNLGAKAGGVDGSTTTGAGEGLNESETVTRITDAYDKVATQMGEEADGVVCYGIGDSRPWADRRNDHWWDFGEGVFTHFKAKVDYVVAYTLIHQWSANSTWYTTPDSTDAALGYDSSIGDPADVRCQRADGTFISDDDSDATTDPATGGSVAATWTDTYYHPNFGSEETQDHIVDLMKRRWVDGDAANGIVAQDIDGIYLDALSMLSIAEDYRSTLTDDQKGFSAYQTAGQVELVRKLRAEARRGGTDFGYFSEWPNEPTGLNLDGLSVSSHPINYGTVTQAPLNLCVFPMIWSEYCPRIDFYSGFVSLVSDFGGIGNILFTQETYGQIWNLIFTQAISMGSNIFLQGAFANRVDLVPDDVEDESDPAYAHWNAWTKDFFEFARNTFTELRAAGAAPGIFAGQMLRELDGTAQRNFIDDRIVTTTAGIEGAEVSARAWYVEIPRPAVWVVLQNSGASDLSYTVKMDRGRYPELPMGTLSVTKVASTGNTQLATFSDALELDVTLPLRGTVILKIERSV